MADAKALFGSDSSDSEEDRPKARALRISPDAEEGDEVKSSPIEENPPTPDIPNGNSDSEKDDEPKAKELSPVRLLADESDEDDDDVQEQPVHKFQRSPDGEVGQEADHAEEAVEEEVAETVIRDDTLVRVNPNLEGNFVYWKVQDYVRGETEAFDPEAYDDDFEDFEEDPSPEVQEAVRHKVLDRMRWRWCEAEDGSRIQESNTKLVKWSDGSTSIVIGNQYFDASVIPLKGEYHQLFIRQGTGLQGGVVFKEKMTLRPALGSGVASRKPRTSAYATGDLAARQERRVVMRMDAAGANLSDMKDPEKRRNELIKKEEERLKATIRRETQQRRVRERVMSRGITSSYLEGREEDEDENDISISAIKNSFKRGEYARQRAYSDDEESEGESRRKKLESAKDLDSDDDDFGVKKKKTEEGSKKRVAVIDDDDEE